MPPTDEQAVAAGRRLDWGALAVRKAPGFAAARDVVELGAGDFSRSIALAERCPAKRFVASDHRLDGRALPNLAELEATPNLERIALDARTVDLPPASVDFIFSIALMEHIADLSDCLRSVHRALRPGGTYFYVQAPFWTCAEGHHFRHDDDETYRYIPKYSHLTHDADDLAALLHSGPEPPFDIEACIRYVFGRPDLSRLGLRATEAIVRAGPFDVVSWTEQRDSRYDEALALAAHPRLLVPAHFEELAVSTAHVVLRKPLGPARRTVAAISRRLKGRR